jgi:carboxymethylenebutenolidase
MGYESLFAETINLQGHQGDIIDGYLARPLGGGPYPAVVMIHHMPGWDEGSKEMARRFASRGYLTILPNLHFREGRSTAQENSTSVRDAGGMPDDRLLGDVEGAKHYLRQLANWNGKVGLIGYCSGGRQAYLAACKLSGWSAVVDCYGGRVACGQEGLTERQPVAPIEFTAGLSCPLLGLFGNEDRNPSPEEVDRVEAELRRLGKTYRFHRYDEAGHAFFTVERPVYRPAAAADGWQKVFAFFAEHLGPSGRSEP